MSNFNGLEREKGPEIRQRRTPLQRGSLRWVIAGVASLTVACAGAQTVEAPEAPISSFNNTDTDLALAAQQLQIKTLNILNGGGVEVVFRGGGMIVSKDGLSVMVDCAPGHENEFGKKLPEQHIDVSVRATGLDKYKKNWGAVIGRELIEDFVSAGNGNTGVEVDFHDDYRFVRDRRYVVEPLDKKEVLVFSVYEELIPKYPNQFRERKPNLSVPVKRVKIVTPDCQVN